MGICFGMFLIFESGKLLLNREGSGPVCLSYATDFTIASNKRYVVKLMSLRMSVVAYKL